MINFLIIGQGLAGSLLGYELIQRGYTVKIVDPAVENTSSNKAAGLFNPITGRKMVKTWLADRLFAHLPDFYRDLEIDLKESFLHELPIYRPFHSIEEVNDWSGKVNDDDYQPYISSIHAEGALIDGLMDPVGGVTFHNTGFVDLPKMVSAFRTYFIEKGAFVHEELSMDRLQVQEKIAYKDIVAEHIIFCDGPRVIENHWWQHLPFKLVRGEIIDIKCDLPMDRVYNRGVFMIPRGDIFRVGSTYDHSILSFEPQQNGIDELKTRLSKLYSGSYEIQSISAGVRPATKDRKPYLGWHPKNKAVGIFNGFGTKGVSLVPYFSKLFVDSIEDKNQIHPEADVSRVL